MNHKILHAVEMLADVIIEKEGAFGMIFGVLEFEARGKTNNDFAYCRNISRVDEETLIDALLSMRGYFMEKLGVKDEMFCGICGKEKPHECKGY